MLPFVAPTHYEKNYPKPYFPRRWADDGDDDDDSQEYMLCTFNICLSPENMDMLHL